MNIQFLSLRRYSISYLLDQGRLCDVLWPIKCEQKHICHFWAEARIARALRFSSPATAIGISRWWLCLQLGSPKWRWQERQHRGETQPVRKRTQCRQEGNPRCLVPLEFVFFSCCSITSLSWQIQVIFSTKQIFYFDEAKVISSLFCDF